MKTSQRSHQAVTLDHAGCYVCPSCGSYLSLVAVKQLLKALHGEAWEGEYRKLYSKKNKIRQGKRGKATDYFIV